MRATDRTWLRKYGASGRLGCCGNLQTAPAILRYTSLRAPQMRTVQERRL